MAEDKKITLSFDGFDDTNDGTIMFEGPIAINRTVNTVNDLYSINLSDFEENSSVVVFVKNVNSAKQGETNYRGAFYRYNWSLGGWQQIVLGNHSHSNIQILDQLGTINTDGLSEGKRYTLTIEKVKDENGELTTDYKIGWENENLLPEVPEDVKGKDLYLSVDKDGNFTWGNSFVPAQTFKVLKKELTVEDLVSNKEVYLSKQIVQDNNLLLNYDLGDEVLVFDSGSLLTNTEVIKNEDGSITVKILDIDNDKYVFEENEVLTLMVIRNGISGIIDTIKEEYFTKKEVIDLVTKGVINLDNYITKGDLQKYAAYINHRHSEYIKRDEYDLFDARYSDYNHTHAEYTTRAQVISILIDAAGLDGEVDTNKLLEDLSNSFKDEIENIKNTIITEDQVQFYINNLKEEFQDAQHIFIVDHDGNKSPLDEYLQRINQQFEKLDNLDTDIVLTSREFEVNNEIGGYHVGEKISKHIPLSQVIHKLFNKVIPAEVVKPEFKYSITQSTNELGAQTTIKIKPEFIQNDAGELIDIQLKINNGTTRVIGNNEIFETTLELIPSEKIEDSYLCYNIELTARYGQGEEVTDNMGMNPTFIAAGEISYTIDIMAEPKYYFGSVDNVPDLDTDLFNIIHTKLNAYETKDIDLIIPKDKQARTIIFVSPVERKQINKIINLNQYADMFNDFDRETHTIKDKSNTLDIEYNVYYYKLSQKAKSDLSFRIGFEGGE